MTLSTLQNRYSWAGDGTSTVFPFNAKFMDDTDLVVVEVDNTTLAETVKTITTHYTVSGGNNAAGAVTMLTAPAVGKTLVIYRNPALTQDLDLAENDRLPVEELEKRLDKLTQIVQRLMERSLRSACHREGFTGSFDPTFPAGMDAVANYGRALIINEDGTGFAFSDEDFGAQTYANVTAAQALNAAVKYYFADPSGGAFALTLPLASANEGVAFVVKHVAFGSGNDVTVSRTGADTIDGETSDTVTAGESKTYVSNGSNWFTVD